ncbi:MAG TPA: hypothetical protein VMI52_04450 [Acetobacteraceae bacterium]|nr:hypothetical protein [Acetobacteraceae bacterium]
MTNVNHCVSISYGLTNEDRSEIESHALTLLSRWEVSFELADGDGCYACLFAPWSDQATTAFLIDRCSDVIILTDRLSSVVQDRVTEHASIQDALLTVQRLVTEPKRPFSTIAQVEAILGRQEATSPRA